MHHPNQIPKRLPKLTRFMVPLQSLLGMVETDDLLSRPDDFVKWYFTVAGPKYQVIALDTRNWRKGRSLYSPPALIAENILEKQITSTSRATGKEITFVLSPVPVLGFPTIEEFLQPGYALTLDVLRAIEARQVKKRNRERYTPRRGRAQ